MNKILYFGSFNPVHYGHTGIARHIATMPEADKVVIIPSPHNPFKDRSMLADPAQRLQQVRLAFDGISPKISVSDIEYHLQEPLYTIKTLHELSRRDPDTELVLLIGADNIGNIGRWYKGMDILHEYRIWVYPRIGYDGESICRKYSGRTDVKGVFYLRDAPLFDISSTMIREREIY